MTGICNGRAATMEVWELLHQGNLEIGKCELASETIRTVGIILHILPSECGKFADSTFLQASRTAVEDSLPCVFHALFCISKGFNCLKERRTRGGSKS